jgi:REP-associated tyrosine transposase
VVVPNGIYHVAPRGNDGRDIYDDDVDRSRHLSLLARAAREFRWRVLGYCQMTNHFHLLLRVQECNLSEGMQQLLSQYARYWNRRHGHTGHLFRNRFTGKLVESEQHLVAAACYIDLNPVRARMKFRPEQWPWSSYRAHAGLDRAPEFLALGEFHKLLGSTPSEASAAYRRLVQFGLDPVSDAGFEP